MKRLYINVAVVLAIGAGLTMSSCIGSFALTSRVMNWNNQIGSKFVNELVFFAFWVLPVYEVTSMADLVVLNSIEFWSGTNPMTASVKAVDTEQGRYMIACDGKGYTITHEPTGRQTRLDFDVPTQTWSVDFEGEKLPFMTMVDDTHVKMITPQGDFRTVELTEQDVMAYAAIANPQMMAQR